MNQLKQSIKKLVEKQYFYPGILGIFINPSFLVRRSLAKNISEFSPHIKGKLLDIGCGSKPYKPLFRATEYVGMEYDSPQNRTKGKADVFYNEGTRFPFPDGHFDSAIATEVLEHVFSPDEFVQETHRVLKKRGMLLLSCPFAWNEHQRPHDYGRYSSFGLAHILRGHGFEIVEQRKMVTGIAALLQLFAAYIRSKITVHNYYIRMFLYAILISPWTFLGVLFSRLSDGESAIYIDNFVLARKT